MTGRMQREESFTLVADDDAPLGTASAGRTVDGHYPRA
jgi:hypothetical protein